MDPIVLIHGFPLDARMWDSQREFLRADPAGAGGHSVLIPELPGFGLAPREPAPPRDAASVEAFAESIYRFIETEAGGRAIVGGFSLGGYVLLALLRAHRQAVSAAMFIDTRPEADTPEARAARLKSIETVDQQGTTAPVVEMMLGRVMGKRPAESVKARVREIMAGQSAAAVVAAQSAMSRRRAQGDLLPELELPVLIIVGAEDTLTPPSVALAMQSHMPHAMVAQIVGAGHMSPMEQPAAVNGAIAAFLATIK